MIKRRKTHAFCRVHRMSQNVSIGMMNMKTMKDMRPGETSAVCGIDSAGDMRRRLMDLGLIQGTRIECVGRSPFGDPAAYLIRGAVIAIRGADGRSVRIQ